MLGFVQPTYGKSGSDFFFVQVGAFDGVTADPIYDLVCKYGWHGILIDPQVEAFELLNKNYAGHRGLQFLNIAVGPHNGDVSLYTRGSGMVQAASLHKHLLNKPGRRSRQTQARTVPCWTFSTLLEKADIPNEIDLVQIDAEGFDYQIIQSIDFMTTRPAMIHYEHMVLSEADRNACLALLASNGYRFLLEDSDTLALRAPSAIASRRSRNAAVASSGDLATRLANTATSTSCST